MILPHAKCAWTCSELMLSVKQSILSVSLSNIGQQIYVDTHCDWRKQFYFLFAESLWIDTYIDSKILYGYEIVSETPMSTLSQDYSIYLTT